jgi:hypothetical protein
MNNFYQAHRFVRWFQTSAKDGTNVTDTFTYLINLVRKKSIYQINNERF